MLIRRMKLGDQLRIGEVLLECVGAGDKAFRISIDAPQGIEIVQTKGQSPAPKSDTPR